MKPEKSNSLSATDQFQRDIIALIPHLRAFARSLCRQPTLGEDLAQEALARAWRSRERFQRGSNLKAWLFTILRNEYYSQRRRPGVSRTGMKQKQRASPRRPTSSSGRWSFLIPSMPCANCRIISAKRWFWWRPVVFPMKMPRRSAMSQSAR